MNIHLSFSKHCWQYPVLVALDKKARSSRPGEFCKKGVFENFVNQRCIPVNFAKFSRSSFHRTSLVAASEKLKAEAVARRCSVKKVFFESLLNSQKTLGPESLFYNLRNATSLK